MFGCPFGFHSSKCDQYVIWHGQFVITGHALFPFLASYATGCLEYSRVHLAKCTGTIDFLCFGLILVYLSISVAYDYLDYC